MHKEFVKNAFTHGGGSSFKKRGMTGDGVGTGDVQDTHLSLQHKQQWSNLS
jgi:hypothetical protein